MSDGVPPTPAEVKDEWGVYVPAPDVTQQVVKEGEYPVAAGAFGDIFKGRLTESTFRKFMGRWSTPADVKRVAIKVMRPLLAVGPDGPKIARVSLGIMVP